MFPLVAMLVVDSENGSVTCWGTGWLGTGGESQSANAGVIWPNLGSGRTAVQIEMGRKHRCVLLDDDSVKCWGDDQYGQLGNGAGQGSKNAPYTTSFSSNLGLQNMISGHWHTCIASKTNQIYCWGDGASGKLVMVLQISMEFLKNKSLFGYKPS